MLKDCKDSGKVIANHEERIRDYLIENYLDNDEVRGRVGIDQLNLRFIIEVPENYDDSYEEANR